MSRSSTARSSMLLYWTLAVAIITTLGVSARRQLSADDEDFKCPDNSPFFSPCTCTGGGKKGIFIRCENTNLASMALGLSNIKLPVEELRLYKCNIKNLRGSLFRSTLVYKLVIEDTPIEDIEEDVFEGVGQFITGLHIYNSKIQGLPTNALKKLTNLEVLEVSGGNITELTPSILPPIKTLKELRLNYCNLTKIGARTLHGMKNLFRIDFHHNNLTEVPNGAFKNKRETQILDLSHNQFKKLDSKYFSDLNKMRWCNMSHNALKGFGRNPFSRNSILGWLSLVGNQIKKIETNTFRSMRQLRRLFLSDNQISQIGRSAFKGIGRVGTIDLSRNKLKSVDTGLFNDLKLTENITLSENQITIIKRNAFKEIFHTYINISHNQITTIEDGAFDHCRDIKILDFSHNNITEISKEAFPGKGSYMIDWRLQHNKIENLGKIPFHFSKLEIVNATYNNIRTIPSLVFPNLYELHTIDLSHNNISHIDNGVFTPLYSIRNINMSYNSITTNLGYGSKFGALPTLLHLDISHNLITKIGRGMFRDLVSIRHLYLNNNSITDIFDLPQSLNYLFMKDNKISSIRNGNWPVMNALLYLDLDNNRFGDSLVSGSFRHLNSLRNLNLKNNSITRPPWEALNEMQTLQYLDLEHNNITNLTRGAFGRLPVVFEINLSNNGVSNISKQAFDGLLQLLKLNLSHNELHNVPNDAFRGLVSLRTVDLSHNFLGKLDNGTHGVFDDLLSIRAINISHNKFFGIAKKLFPYHKWIPYNLQDVDMSNNNIPILTKNILVGCQKVKRLNFSNNILNEIRPGILGNLTKLEVIDISHNELEALGQATFGRDRSLKEVYLQNNSLISIPSAVLLSNKNLTMLNLENNNLHTYYKDMVPRVISGTKIKFEGNPVECDCQLRPVRAWLSNMLNGSEWRDIVCKTPIRLAGKALPQISESELRCSDIKDRTDTNLQVTPDVRFRMFPNHNDVQPHLDVNWYVTTREDVGGFLVTVFNSTNGKELTRDPLDYIARGKEYPKLPRGKYRVCIAALDSVQNVRPIQAAQCDTRETSAAGKFVANHVLLLVFTLTCIIML